jgi:hypothetical protein
MNDRNPERTTRGPSQDRWVLWLVVAAGAVLAVAALAYLWSVLFPPIELPPGIKEEARAVTSVSDAIKQFIDKTKTCPKRLTSTTEGMPHTEVPFRLHMIIPGKFDPKHPRDIVVYAGTIGPYRVEYLDFYVAKLGPFKEEPEKERRAERGNVGL